MRGQCRPLTTLTTLTWVTATVRYRGPAGSELENLIHVALAQVRVRALLSFFSSPLSVLSFGYGVPPVPAIPFPELTSVRCGSPLRNKHAGPRGPARGSREGLASRGGTW